MYCTKPRHTVTVVSKALSGALHILDSPGGGGALCTRNGPSCGVNTAPLINNNNNSNNNNKNNNNIHNQFSLRLGLGTTLPGGFINIHLGKKDKRYSLEM